MIVAIAISNTPTLDHQKQPAPFSNAQLTVKWLDWCAFLGGIGNAELVVLMPAGHALPESVKAWGKVTIYTDREQTKGWPQGPNSCFRQLAWNLFYRGQKTGQLEPWLFCEPDCVPLRAGWLAEITQAYERAQKPFMGVLVSAEAAYPAHMAGNAVYPARAVQLAPTLVSEKKSNVAFDIRGAAQVVPQMAKTELIVQRYRRPPFTNLAEFRAEVPQSAVLFHSDKYGAIINLLSVSMAAVAGGQETPAQQEKDLPVVLKPEVEPEQALKASTAAPVFSHAELCEVISANVKSETARSRLMTFLREKHFHQKNFGAAVQEQAVNAG